MEHTRELTFEFGEDTFIIRRVGSIVMIEIHLNRSEAVIAITQTEFEVIKAMLDTFNSST